MSTSPEGRVVLHQAVDKSFVCGQELRWAEKGLCTTEDSQSATGFGDQVGTVFFPGKIMADSETQKLERKDFFQTHTHTHTHTHTYTDTCTHTYTDAHTDTYTHVCMHMASNVNVKADEGFLFLLEAPHNVL